MEKYNEWIKKEYPTPRSALAKCREAVNKMVDAFPELKRTNGFVYFIGHEKRMHWWCIDEGGEIVDPTAHQFIDYIGRPILFYEEIDDEHDARNFPRARCMECGEYYFQKPELKGTMHTKECEKSFMESFQ